MGENQKLMAVVIGMFAVVAIMIALGKQDESPEIVAEKTRLMTFSSMQGMAGQKCPVAIKNLTGTEVYFPTGNQSDKETYVTLTYKGTEKGDKFKTAVCTLTLALGGISKLIIDDEVMIDKQKMTSVKN